MLNYLIFFNSIIWVLFFSFLIAPNNLFFLILLSELIWVTLYCLTSMVGSIIDDITCFSINFFILGFASIELCFGLLLLIVLKQLRFSTNLLQNTKKSTFKMLNKNTIKLQIKPRL